jgi:hypothetical protein
MFDVAARILPEYRFSVAERDLAALPKVLLSIEFIMSIHQNQSYSDSAPEPTTTLSASPMKKETDSQPVIKLAPSMWLRAMTDFDAPFGHDGLPTVWG